MGITQFNNVDSKLKRSGEKGRAKATKKKTTYFVCNQADGIVMKVELALHVNEIFSNRT